MECASGLRSSEWQFAGLLGAGSTVVGYYIGKPAFMHRPTAALAGVMGLFYGYCYGFQNSTGRLMGLRENGPELEALQQVR